MMQEARTLRPFCFLRHGETDWNRDGRLQGQADVPLNEAGCNQAAEAGRRLASSGIEAIISSPLQRTWQTAGIIAAALGCPVFVDEQLKERNFGLTEGLLREEIEGRLDDPDLFDLDSPIDFTGRRCPRGAEALQDVAARAYSCVESHLALHTGKNLLFVGHAAWFRIFIHAVLGEIHTLENAIPYSCNLQDGVIQRM